MADRVQYGLFLEKLLLDGVSYPAEPVSQSYAERAGFAKIHAVNGLPPRFETALVKAAQVCDVPHTWRVKEAIAESDVTDDVVQRGLHVLTEDQKERGAHIITYLGDDGLGHCEFLAAGAIRDKLTKDFHDPLYPVVSRAVVAPKYRGKGIGSLIVEHRFKAALNFFGAQPKAIHFGTESEKVMPAIRRVEQEEGLTYVHIGNENYESSDGTHSVTDYLCFLPWFQQLLLQACDVIIETVKTEKACAFKDKLSLFMTSGIQQVKGAELEQLFRAVQNFAHGVQDENIKTALQQIGEIFIVKKKIGAIDPD